MDDTKRGLYGKYKVERLSDPDGKHEDCYYFILDTVHDKHSLAALEAYAGSCMNEYPLLAMDLMQLVEAMKEKGWTRPTLYDTLPMGGIGE